MCVYGGDNAAHFDLALESVFNQSLAPDEVVLVVDGPVNDEINGVIQKYDELCGFISENSEGFAFDRIYKVDLAILLVALYEIKYMKSIPVKVSINEALNLAKSYSTENSNKFINGILAKLVK